MGGNSALVVGGTHPDNCPTRPDLALIELTREEWGWPALRSPAARKLMASTRRAFLWRPRLQYSWAAVIGGAIAAAALALVLLALEAGFALGSVSPSYNSRNSATTFTIAAAIWLIIVQWLSSALGGYPTGRRRMKWVGVHTHELCFREHIAASYASHINACSLGSDILIALIRIGIAK